MTHCLYRHFAEDGQLLYVGISLSALQRLGQHSRHSGWFRHIKRVDVEHFETRKEAIAAERIAVETEKPHYNKNFNTNPTEYQKQVTATRKRREIEGLFDRLVSFAPFYKMTEVAQVLRCSTPLVKRLIEDGELGAIILREDTQRRSGGKEVKRVSYGVTGWQLIEFLEHLERTRSTDRSPAAAFDEPLRKSRRT